MPRNFLLDLYLSSSEHSDMLNSTIADIKCTIITTARVLHIQLQVLIDHLSPFFSRSLPPNSLRKSTQLESTKVPFNP